SKRQGVNRKLLSYFRRSPFCLIPSGKFIGLNSENHSRNIFTASGGKRPFGALLFGITGHNGRKVIYQDAYSIASFFSLQFFKSPPADYRNPFPGGEYFIYLYANMRVCTHHFYFHAFRRMAVKSPFIKNIA